jgi:hypothetical protein
MIDITTEKLVTLKQARAHVPQLRPGNRVDQATLWRWTVKGLRCRTKKDLRIRLESAKIGGVLVTSVEALHRFFERLNEAAAAAPEATGMVTSSAAKKDRIQTAKRRLATKAPSNRATAGATP